MSELIARFRPKFLARPRREKLLLVAFLLALAFVWLGSLLGRAKSATEEIKVVRKNADEQQGWLDEQTVIESRFDSAMAALRDAPLPPRQEVTAGIERLLRKHGLADYQLPKPESLESDGMGVNTFNISINNAQWDSLLNFHEEIATALPTVNIAEIQLRSTARPSQPNPSPLLSARVQLVAVEINR